MDSTEAISKRWIEEGRKFVASVNKYLHDEMTLGGDKVGEPPRDTRIDLAQKLVEIVRQANEGGDIESLRRKFADVINEYEHQGMTDLPRDTRIGLAEKVMGFVRQANETGDIESLRRNFPPAHDPFVGMLRDKGQHLGPIALLDDGRILVRVGYGEGAVYIINGLIVKPVENVISFGQSPNRKFIALAKQSGVEVHEGWEGPQIASFNWPTGLEGIPAGVTVEPLNGIPPITQLLPFPDGTRVLLVSTEGIFVLATDITVRLYPRAEDYRECFELQQTEYPDEPLSLDIDMEHGAISPDGTLIAVGCQDSSHLVYDDKYELVGDIGPICDYPHYAVFSEDGKLLACNSCHLYNGVTIGIPLSLLPGFKTEPYALLDSRLVVLEDGARVYAGTSRQDEFILGDADGYLRAVDRNGGFRWLHHIGSSICDIDISQDKKTLIASTYGGVLSVIALDTGTKDPDTIGTATHQEIRRWLFWKKEKKPLAW